MELFGVLPPRNALTDWHKIWHGWLRRGRDSVPQMACQSVQGRDPTKGWNVNGLCFFLFVHQRSWGSNRWTDSDA